MRPTTRSSGSATSCGKASVQISGFRPAAGLGMTRQISIRLLGAAHESGELGIETRSVLEERRMTDALIDREFGAGDHFRRVFGGDEVRVLVVGPMGHQHR